MKLLIMKTLGLIKRGVILPNNVQEWERANDYFRDHLHLNNKVKDVNKEMKDMQNKIHKYFSETHGQVKDKKIEIKKLGKKPTKKQSEISKSESSRRDKTS